MHKNIPTVVGIAILFLGTCITPSVAIDNVKKSFIPISNNNILYVGGTGEGNYSNIQDAIDDASKGDTVFVFNGTYYENIVVNKSINLYGECKDTTFIEDFSIEDVINISADWVNISGFSIPWGYYVGIGIYSSNNTFTGNNILNYAQGGIGISINSNYNIISDNNISNCYYGIYLSNSIIGNSILGNNISNNYEHGIWLDSSNGNTIMGNTISLNGMYGIILKDSTNNTISTNNISWNQDGILVSSAQYNSIIGNNFVNNTHDLGLYKSNNNTISDNIFSETHCCRSIGIRNSSNNYINNNIIINGGFSGINIVDNSSFNIITGNIISHIFTSTREGIRIWVSCSNNTIINNTISSVEYGIYILEFSSNNTIYHNTFISNTHNAKDECNNTWDNNYPSGGNYWDDYNGTDSNGDGIGDTPYMIPGGSNKDRYPLMEPYRNQPPEAPVINGPPRGKAGISYSYTFNLTDPDGDDIADYTVKWGDGVGEINVGPFASGTLVTTSHTWTSQGNYTIKAKVKDIYGAESSWSEFEVNIPRTKATSYLWYYEWLLERFPFLYVIWLFCRIPINVDPRYPYSFFFDDYSKNELWKYAWSIPIILFPSIIK